MDMTHYFATVKTFEDYEKLRSTGMAWELFDDFPQSWEDHTQMKLMYDYHKWVDSK